MGDCLCVGRHRLFVGFAGQCLARPMLGRGGCRFAQEIGSPLTCNEQDRLDAMLAVARQTLIEGEQDSAWQQASR